ncbi:MAG: type II toxin-antitoxin system HicB family antitoxin [Lacibacter sp.]|jgi:predicted RNase H-like HicB family nuclease
MATTRTLRIVLRKEADGNYTAIVPSLPGCITWGDSVETALQMAREAIEAYVAVLEEEGEPIPDDADTFEYSMQLTA